MPLAPGTRLGPYEILGPIGAGGMGEIHRARDTRLRRDVAIKVLPADFTSDAERLRRFEQEAHAIGALNHPNILAVYDFGAGDGAPYLVTELLEGATLRDEMPPPRRKALDYARQIAAGLAAAHAKGVIHRDLKPENIFVTTDGRVKILDFGLAKVQLPQSESDATRTVATTPGVTMGTVGYMSPEQARGKPADTRSDIFSFGAILYEMLSGQRAFARESAMDTISAILKEDPPPLADAAVDRIVRRCLEKSPDQRFQSASDLGFALEALSGSVTSQLPVTTAKPARRTSWLVAAGLALAALAVGAIAEYWWQSRRPADPPWRGDLLTASGIAYMPRISPDGKTLAFVVIEGIQAQIAIMHPGSRTWTVITSDKTRGEASTPAWSPDGTKIYFARNNSIYSIPALGGEERPFIDQAVLAEPIADGTFVIARQNADRKMQLFRYSPESSRADPLDAEALQGGFVRVFRDGGEAVYFGHALSDPKPSMNLMAVDLKSGKSRVLSFAPTASLALETTARGTVLATHTSGDLIEIAEIPRDGKSPPRPLLTVTSTVWALTVASDGTIYADQVRRPIDILRFPLTGGAPERLVETSQASFQTAIPTPDGRAIYCSLLGGKPTVFITRPGKNPIPLVDTEEGTNGPLALAGNGLAVIRIGSYESGGTRVLALVSIAEGRVVRRVEATRGIPMNAVAASPDGKTIFYVNNGAVFSLPIDGGEPREIGLGDSIATHPNGKELIIARDIQGVVNLYRLPIDGGAEQQIPYKSDLILRPMFSPAAVRADGKIAINILRQGSWWDEPAILNPATGSVEKLTVPYDGDVLLPSWTADGRMIATGFAIDAALWRFQLSSPVIIK